MLIKSLITLANNLDNNGFNKEAKAIDMLLHKIAAEPNIDELKSLFQELINLSNKKERTIDEQNRMQQIRITLNSVERIPVSPEKIEQWHKNPPVPSNQFEPGDKKFIVFNKDYAPYIGIDSVQVFSIYAKDEAEAKHKITSLGITKRKPSDLAASEERPEHVALYNERSMRLEKQIQQDKKKEKQQQELNKAKEQLYYAQSKGEKDRNYSYHMKQFARHMKNAVDTPEEMEKYKAMELEYDAIWRNQPELSNEELGEELRQMRRELENIREDVPGFNKKMPSMNN